LVKRQNKALQNDDSESDDFPIADLVGAKRRKIPPQTVATPDGRDEAGCEWSGISVRAISMRDVFGFGSGFGFVIIGKGSI
jgi:hypothetical protein